MLLSGEPIASSLSHQCFILISELDLAMAYMQLHILEEDRFKTLFRVSSGQYEFRGCTFGLHCMS